MIAREHLERAALFYAGRGWPVVDLFGLTERRECTCREGAACRSPGKHPRARNGLLEATDDPDEIRRRWARGDVAPNVGITTGRASGVVVLDVDPRNGGDVSIVSAVLERGPLGRTLEVHTGGGGSHYYFARPAVESVPSRKLKAVGPGIDLKADGGYVVAAPSVHASGGAYAWANLESVAPLPPWLASVILAEPEAPRVAARAYEGRYGPAGDLDQRMDRARAYVAAIPGAISGQGGHEATFRVAVALVRGFELPRNHALEVLADWNRSCRPFWSLRELNHKIDDAIQRSTVRPGYLLEGASR